MFPREIGGRYTLIEEIGRGGMGVVHRALEAGRDRPVALKFLSSRRYSESALRFFEQEFRTLATLSHPNLTEVHDFGRFSRDDGQVVPFFTMELVEGRRIDVDFAASRGDWNRLYACIAQVGQALSYLHSRGYVHQDVKPSNVFVLDGADGVRVKLMDLGLAGPLRDAADEATVRGTVAYLAPESVRGGPADPRSDLYSLGCTLYTVITGRPPFPSGTPLEIVRAHLGEEPLPVRTFRRDVPEPLERLVHRLLRKEPGQRPPTADHFLRELREASGGAVEVHTAEVRRRRVLGAGFVGREAEIDRLESLLDESKRGGAPLVLLVGPAGAGKSRLLREFEVRCQIRGDEVHVARPDGPRGSAAALGEALERALRAREPWTDPRADGVRRIVARLLGRDDPSSSDADAPLSAAVADAVAALASQGPLVLLVEDLHGADETTCDVLRHSLRGAGPGTAGGPPLLWIGAYRGDEVSRALPLFDLLADGREEGWTEEVSLGPLEREPTSKLLGSMLGLEHVPGPFVERVFEETRGNPLHIAELLSALAEEGHVEPGSSEPPDPDVLARVALPGRVRDLLARRLERVPPEALHVLRAAAMLGRNVVDADAVSAVTGLRWEAVLRQLRELSLSGALERGEDPDGTPRFRLALPGLADLVAEGTPDDQARGLHERALSYLERRGVPRRPDAFADLARHAERAGRSGRAVDAWSRAADLAREAHALRDASEFYGRAIELALRQGEGAAAVLCTLYERRGEIFRRVGDLPRAEEDARWMVARAESSGSDALRSRAQLALGRARLARGDPESAREGLELALVLAERAGDAALAAVAATALGAAVGRGRDPAHAFPVLARGIELAEKAGRPDLAASALLTEGTLHRETGNYKRALARLEEAEIACRGRPDGHLEIAILEGTALAHELRGRSGDAALAYGKAAELARRRGDAATAARLTQRLGCALFRAGDLEAARAKLEEALAAFRRFSIRDAVVETLGTLADVHRIAGRRPEATETILEALGLARRTGRKEPLSAALCARARLHLAEGALQRAASTLQEAQDAMRAVKNPALHAEILVEAGESLRAAQEAGESRRVLQEAAFHAKQAGDRRLEAVALFRLGQAWLDDNDADRALVACRRGMQLLDGAGLPREEAEGLRLRSRIELVRPGGDVVRSHEDAEESLRKMERVGDGEGVALAAFLSAKSAQRLGRPDEAGVRLAMARKWLDRSRASLPEEERAAFVSDPRRREIEHETRHRSGSAAAGAGESEAVLFAARQEVRSLKRILELNRVFSSTRDPQALLRSVLDAALELTGAERGFLLLADGAEFETRSARGADGATLAGDETELSRSVARTVLREGRPVLSSDTASDDAVAGIDSVLDLRIRSLLAVPLRTAEGVAGALYLDSRIDRGVLTSAHQDLAARLADQAALALDTARLLERIEEQRETLARLNEELERTAEAQRNELAEAREALVSTRSSMEMRFRFEGLVGGSAAMQRVYHLVERLAPKRLPVLVAGESGTGKELIARALHARSDRSGGPFFSVNCAALPENLLESELFGYRKGAFTGADRNKPGFFQLAHGGTLFLDEIGEMGAAMQAKLLRVLQEGEVLPIGAAQALRVDVRIVSATNRDLGALVKNGTFREDLFYRVHVARIELPPLRARRDDIPLLVDHFLGDVAAEEGSEKRAMEGAALRRLSEHAWPGNVRELQHVVHRLCAFSRGTALTLADLERYGDLSPERAPAEPAAAEGPVESLEQIERRQILRALDESGGNKTRAAELLGINRATLFRKLKRFGFDA